MPHPYNFGIIRRRPVKKDFIVKNTGGKLLVTFDPNIMNKGMNGDIYRTIYIRSNDPEQPEVKIEIRATLTALKKSDGK